MATCATCGNEYDKTFTMTWGDRSFDFDSFECAISTMAPVCAHCNCRILGHGVEVNGVMYCCAHCARHEGAQGVQDRADDTVSH
ncbi:MAG: hypothetical protein ICV72_14215 [Aldersonia sp.]|nr:hypothetical protein [Aldersonia sp.]